MEEPINQRRLSDISFIIDKNLTAKDGNRSFFVLLRKTDVSDVDFSTFLNENDSKNLKYCLQNLQTSDEPCNFVAKIKHGQFSSTCLLTIKKIDEDSFSVVLEELSYSRHLLDKALLESREYTALLQNFDAYYFIYDGKIFTIKNTKDLNSVFKGDADGFKLFFQNTFKVNLKIKETAAQFDFMIEDIINMEANKYFNFLQTDKKLLTVHTLKTRTRNSSMIVGSVNFGKKTDPATNLYAESRDGLTGLYNKKAITELAVKKINEQKTPCSLIIIDIDKFKECNDTYGHVFGDRVIVAVSSCIKDAINGVGIAGRIGGDEFLIILDKTDEEDIRNITRNIRTAIQWNITSVEPGSIVTCSMGIARFPSNAENYDDLFKMADKCLYIAKYRGRNCYIIYKPEIHDKILAENEVQEDKVSTGQLYHESSSNELEILSLLSSKKNGSVKSAVDKLLEYMQVSKITVYDKKFKLFYVTGKDSFDYRSERLQNKDFFNHYNQYGFYHLDNTNILDSIDGKLYSLYSEPKISSTLEILCKDEKDNIKGLVCFDIYRPARTFQKDKITFALVAAKLISNYI